MKIRVLTLLLAIIMTLGAFVSCTGNGDSNEKEEHSNNTEDVTTTVGEETQYLEDVTFPEQKVNLLYWEGTENDEFNIEKTTGNPINDAIYARDLRVQDQL